MVIAALLGVGCFVLYVKTLAPTVLMADPSEFQLACYTLGLAHPTGYPLYLIIGWLWSHVVPLGDAAYRTNLLSAVFAAASVGLFYLLALRVFRGTLQERPGAVLRAVAAVSTLTLALSRTYWSQALTAEVYALNSLFVVALLLVLLRWSESRSLRTLCLAALVYGLSLTHHSTMILFLPACALFVWLTDRSVFRNRSLLLTLAVLVVAPLALYVYIPLRASATPYLYVELAPGRTLALYNNSLRGFLGFLAGEMFVGELGLQAPLLERMAMAAGLLLKQYGLAGAALGVLGVAKLGLGARASLAHRLLALLGLSYIALVAFTLIYNVGDIHVFYTPSYIIFAVCVALGMGWLLCTTARFLPRVSLGATAPGTWALVAVLALLPARLFVANYAGVDRSHDYHAREWAEGVLSQPIPPGAILISNDRNEITPLLYLQHVEGVRPDLLTMFPLMLPGEEYSNVVRVIDGVLDVDRPLFLVKAMPGLEVKYRMEPSGPLVEVTGPATAAPPSHLTNLDLEGRLVLVGFDLEPEHPSPGDQLEVILHWHATQDMREDYHTYAHLLDEQGRVVAQSDHRPGQDYYPTSLWRPGETLWDVHELAISPDLDVKAATLVVGAYEYPSLVPLDSALTLSKLPISR